MGTVYIQRECGDVKHAQLVNGTGSALAQYELTVQGGLVLIADEAIASTAVGSFNNDHSYSGQISEFIAEEGDFATANAVVYWDPSSGNFSDTSTATYYPVGIVQEVKNSSGVVLVLFDRETVVIPAAEE